MVLSYNLDADTGALAATGCKATRSGGCCTQAQCTSVLQTKVNQAAGQAAAIFGNQCACVQAVLTDLTYNLGDGGMRGFPHFIAQIKAHDWKGAASNLQGAFSGTLPFPCLFLFLYLDTI